jgi:hypothetical protein
MTVACIPRHTTPRKLDPMAEHHETIEHKDGKCPKCNGLGHTGRELRTTAWGIEDRPDDWVTCPFCLGKKLVAYTETRVYQSNKP